MSLAHGVTAAHGGEPLDFFDEAAALPTQSAPLLLCRLRHAHHGQGVFVAGLITRQMLGKFTRIAPIGLDLAAVLVPILRAHDMTGDACGGKFALQRVAQRPSLVAADYTSGQQELLTCPSDELSWLEALCRLGGVLPSILRQTTYCRRWTSMPHEMTSALRLPGFSDGALRLFVLRIVCVAMWVVGSDFFSFPSYHRFASVTPPTWYLLELVLGRGAECGAKLREMRVGL